MFWTEYKFWVRYPKREITYILFFFGANAHRLAPAKIGAWWKMVVQQTICLPAMGSYMYSTFKSRSRL